MTPAQLQTIEEIFYAALEQDSDDVARFLERTCEGDELLRGEVEALLASRQRVGSFIQTPAVAIATRIIGNGQADLLVGQTIGHYKISKQIGTGGMGEVYLATDVVAGRKAALKLLPLRFTGDAERLKRFEQEARAVVGLNHPNIVTVYEIGEENSIHYIASELIEGETLRDRLTRGPLQLTEALEVAIQVASALAAAHQAVIVHRDIKPENIMLRPDGYAKVLDFGIAKLAEQELPTSMPRDEALLLVETNLGSILGTAHYMSPEQARGQKVNARSDIWSLGVVLYEIVTGNPPFRGETPSDCIAAILTAEPAPLSSVSPDVPARLESILQKALRKNTDERYQTIKEMLAELRSLKAKLEAESSLSQTKSHGDSNTSEIKRPKRGVLVTLGAALFASAAVACFFFFFVPAALTNKKSIAVLPFENLSEDKSNAYFADGIQDEILTRLSKIADIKVISRTSTQRYKKRSQKLSEIANQLGVANLLEGSVQKTNDQVRVNVQLIRAANDSHLW